MHATKEYSNEKTFLYADKKRRGEKHFFPPAPFLEKMKRNKNWSIHTKDGCALSPFGRVFQVTSEVSNISTWKQQKSSCLYFADEVSSIIYCFLWRNEKLCRHVSSLVVEGDQSWMQSYFAGLCAVHKISVEKKGEKLWRRGRKPETLIIVLERKWVDKKDSSGSWLLSQEKASWKIIILWISSKITASIMPRLFCDQMEQKTWRVDMIW